MTVDTATWIGMVLSAGRYEVRDKLGEGGMGYVYRAHDRNLDCDVVIKVPRRSMLEDADFSARFAREIRSLVRLVHPHIVKVMDVGEQEGLPFAVMQYLSGGSVRERQKNGPDGQTLPLPCEHLREWLEPTAAALDFIHKQNYIHRDVKPDNILFDAHGNAYLSDFGVAKVLAEKTETRQQTLQTGSGIVLGTPQYMAPELLLGKNFDGRVDQYALAVMVYEMVSGRYPFDGPTSTAIFVQHTTQPAAPLDSVANVPKGVAASVQKGLAKDPKDRYADCATMAHAILEGILAADSPPPRRTGLKPTPAPAAPPRDAVTLKVACPGCKKTIAIPSSMTGKRLRCPGCGQQFQAPGKLHTPATSPDKPIAQPQATEQSRVDTRAGMAASPSATPSSSKKIAPAAQQMSAVDTVATAPASARGKSWKLIAAASGALAILAGIAVVVALSTRSSDQPRPGTGSKDRVAQAKDTKQNQTEKAPGAGSKQEDVGGNEDLASNLSVKPNKNLPVDDAVTKSFPRESSASINPDNVEAGEIRQLKGHTDIVWSVAISPGGHWALSGSGGQYRGGQLVEGSDNTARLWDLATGQEVYQFAGSAGPVFCVAFSPNGRRALTGGDDQILRLWDLTNGKLIHAMEGHTRRITAVAFSSDNRFAVSGSGDHTIRQWDLATGRSTHAFYGHSEPITALAYARGRVLSSSEDKTLRLWDAGFGGELRQVTVTDNISSVAFSRDGALGLTGGRDATIRLWQIPELRERRRVGKHVNWVTSVALSPDGKRAISGGYDNRVRLWNVSDGREIRHFDWHTETVRSVAFGPDGKVALSAGDDRTIRLWALPGNDLIANNPDKEKMPDEDKGEDIKPTTKPPGSEKAPVPEAAAQANATNLIKDLYKADYAKRRFEEILALAHKLIQEANNTKDDVVGRFVLLREARDLAAKVGNVPTLLQAIDNMNRWYVIDALAMKTEALENTAAATSVITSRTLAETSLSLLEEANEEGDYAMAKRLLAVAEGAAKKAASATLLAAVERQSKVVDELQSYSETIESAAKKLKIKADDPEANLILGKHLCFRKGAWDEGLPMLASGNDVQLQTLAKKELAQPDMAEMQAAIADGWWDVGEKSKGRARTQILSHAKMWYDQALPGLSGLLKTKADTRLSELQKAGIRDNQVSSRAGTTYSKASTSDIHVIANLTSSGTLEIKPGQIRWIPVGRTPAPTFVRLNNLRWNPRRLPNFKAGGTNALLKIPVDFDSAELVKKRGSGFVQLMKAPNRVMIRFNTGNSFGGSEGGEIYDVVISFKK